MNKPILLITLILLAGRVFGQGETFEDKVTRKYEKDKPLIIQTHSKIHYNLEYEDSISLVFQLDTFRVNLETRMRSERAMTTVEIAEVFIVENSNYDKLLNKYYKLLTSKLSDKDKNILKDSQINWMKFRDSEIKTIQMISENKYSLGGTMRIIDNAAFISNLTKRRVIELFEHLLRLRPQK